MQLNAWSFIEEWFDKQNGDGEFVRDVRAEPYSVIGPTSRAGQVVFATKPRIVSSAFVSNSAVNQICLLGRSGLPNEDDLVWIQEFVHRRKLLFLGDMDPVDLLVFAWLRGRMPSMEVVHLGINDRYLESLGCDDLQCSEILCGASERESMTVLQQALPDLREIIGSRCHELLQNGKKLELEAVVSATGTRAAVLFPALRLLDT